jgi:hypothetical protein
MPLKYWDEAFLVATYLINHLSTKVLDFSSPLERLFRGKPHYNALRTFGCACWPNLRPFNTHKLQFCSTQCVFLGYSNIHKGFKCLDVATGRVYISRDVVFDETVYPFTKLNPNAGARLRDEILLLPTHNQTLASGVHCADDSCVDVHPTHVFSNPACANKSPAELKRIHIQTRLLIHAVALILIQIVLLLSKMRFNLMSSIPVWILLSWTGLRPSALSQNSRLIRHLGCRPRPCARGILYMMDVCRIQVLRDLLQRVQML